MNYRLIIFDVDGTLVTTKSGATFRKTADDWEFLPGRIEKCNKLQEDAKERDDFLFFALASNQAGVAFPWSKFTEADITVELIAVACCIDTSYTGICFTTPNEKALPQYYNPNDPNRKPNPGMLLTAMKRFDVSPEETLMVGDRDEDRLAAEAAGVAFIHADSFFI